MPKSKSASLPHDNQHDPLRTAAAFQDNKAHQVIRLRASAEKYPLRFLASFVIYAITWLLIIDPGLSNYYSPSMGVIFVPHGGISLLAIGIIFFPLRLMSLPIIAFSGLFAVSVFLASNDPTPEINQFISHIDLLGLAFASNLLIGIVSAGMTRLLLKRIIIPGQNLLTDMSLILFSGLIFVAIAIPVALGYERVLRSIATPDILSTLGTANNFFYTSLLRTVLSGVIISAFFLTAFQMTRWKDLIMAVVAGLPLVTVGILVGRQGYDPGIELAVLLLGTAFMCLVVPLSYAIPSMIIGTLSFVTFTDVYQIWVPNENLPLSTILLFLTVILCDISILAIRSHYQNVDIEQRASMQRLNTVRNYAGVGVFSMDIQKRMVHVDTVTQRMMNVPPSFDITFLMRRLGQREQTEIRKLMFQRPGETTTLLAQLRPDTPFSQSRVIRLFFWYEEDIESAAVIYGLVVDVTGEHMQERTLKETLAELSIRQDQQKQLFSIISHEVRSPASVISMLVEDIDKDPDKFTHRLGLLREATSQMMATLTDMRQAVNPEKNLPINLLPFVPADLAESLRNIYNLQANAANIQIKLRLGGGAHETCVGDTVRIKQIVGNLIRNAIIHSHSQNITISYRAAYNNSAMDRSGIWSVTDDGVGIDTEDVSKLFEPFQRGGSDPSKRADGSGLGLYIVRSSSELLGGTVEYFPAPEGGAGYHIRLPEPELPKGIKGDKDHPTPEVDFSKLSVLFVEDNHLVAEVTLSRLKKMFGKISYATDGLKALDLVKSDPPDLIITDLFMPEMTGDELTRVLRRDGFDKPIIGLTAAVVGDDQSVFLDAGASIVLAKPLEEPALRAFIAEQAENLGLRTQSNADQ